MNIYFCIHNAKIEILCVLVSICHIYVAHNHVLLFVALYSHRDSFKFRGYFSTGHIFAPVKKHYTHH